SDLRGLASARPGQPLPRAALGAAARADVDVPAGTRATAGGRAPARPVHSNLVVARTGRRAVFLLILALLAGHGPVSPQSIPATRPGPPVVAGFTPAARGGSVFRNLDPEYRRAPMWMRARAFVVGATWLASEHRVAPLARGTADPPGTRDQLRRQP